MHLSCEGAGLGYRVLCCLYLAWPLSHIIGASRPLTGSSLKFQPIQARLLTAADINGKGPRLIYSRTLLRYPLNCKDLLHVHTHFWPAGENSTGAGTIHRLSGTVQSNKVWAMLVT